MKINITLLYLDELSIVTNATNEVQNDTCDFTACNGFTLKLDVFDKVQTYGQCQYPAGENGAEDDFFCFVNADSACKDKVVFLIFTIFSQLLENFVSLSFHWKNALGKSVL